MPNPTRKMKYSSTKMTLIVWITMKKLVLKSSHKIVQLIVPYWIPIWKKMSACFWGKKWIISSLTNKFYKGLRVVIRILMQLTLLLFIRYENILRIHTVLTWLKILFCFSSGYRRWKIPATCIFNYLTLKSRITRGSISDFISSS